MKKKERPSFEGLILDNLRRKAENRQSELLNHINYGLNLLLWQIGNLTNIAIKENSGDENNLVSTISEKISPVFGDYFNTQNISVMREFARKFSYEAAETVASVTNWRYLSIFLNLNEQISWELYNKIIHANSLTPSVLKMMTLAGKKITSELSHSDLPTNHSFLKSKTFLHETIDLYFAEDNKDSFRHLFEPKTNSLFSENASSQKIILEITEKISVFQMHYNYLLNLKFNTLFWEIGEEITRLSKMFDKSVTESLAEDCSLILKGIFPAIYNKEELAKSLKFASQYQQLFEYLDISETVPWQYLRKILEIPDTKQQSYLANKIFWDGEDLSEVSAINWTDATKNNQDSEHQLNERKSILRSIDETIDGNKVSIGYFYERPEPKINPENDVNRNIFKNPDLLQFLTFKQ